MRLRKSICWGILPLLAMNACTSLDDKSEWDGSSQAISFVSYIKGTALKAIGTDWSNEDRVGIYMTGHGAGLASAIASNRQYIADGTGKLTAASTDEALAYPEDGSAVDFVAYYPYTATASGATLDIDISDQTDQEAIDLLYSDNAQGITSGTVNLGFSHELSQVILDIQADATIATTAGLDVTASNVATTGTFDLDNGSLSVTSGSTGSVAFLTNEAGTKAEAILLPTADASGITLRFTLDGQSVERQLTVSSLEAGTSYTIPVSLGNSSGNVYVQFGTATITPWTNVTGGDINVDFAGGTTETPDPTPDPGTEETIFEETFGESVSKKSNDYWPALNETDLWTSTSGLAFSDPLQEENEYTYSNITIRQTSTLDPHAWLPANKDSQMRMEGFSTTGYTSLTLTYSITANSSGNQDVIRVLWGDEEVTVPSADIATQNQYQTVTITGLGAGATSLTFVSDQSSNTAGYRIDNITLTGTR